MIILSAHQDKVISDYKVSFLGGIHQGLLDNSIGILLTYLLYYEDAMIRRFEREGKIKIYHSQGEEWSILTDPPKVTKKDLVICIDVAAGAYYDRADFTLENISGITDSQYKDMKDTLRWEGMKANVRRFTGNEAEEDEAWKWRDLGIPVISFIIPIKAKDNGWHRVQQDSCVSADTVLRCRQGLKRLINCFMEAYG